jgi:hypothetical protein
VAGTIADITATEPSFTVERFGPVGERLEVAGHWQGLRGRRFVRPVLWLHTGDSRRRLVAVLDHKPWADDGGVWLAAFVWDGGKVVADRAELEVGSDLVVDLPLPGARKRPAEPRPAQKRRPTEAELLREQLAAEIKERRELQRTLDGVEREADALARVRAERDAARETAEHARAEGERRIGAARAEAEHAREDGERLVNDEYRQRQRAEALADEAARARDLAERQLAAARDAHAALEARLADAEERSGSAEEIAAARDRIEAERDRLATERDKAVGAHDRLVAEIEGLRQELAAANEDRDKLRADLAVPAVAPAADTERLEAELAAGRADRERLEGELAGAWADHDRLSAELGAAREGRERVEAELVAARADRKRLERELADLRAEAERRPLRRRAPATSSASRIAPPRSGGALWTARAVSLALVVLLLVAIALVVTRIA